MVLLIPSVTSVFGRTNLNSEIIVLFDLFSIARSFKLQHEYTWGIELFFLCNYADFIHLVQENKT